jgi:SAM-dependent methyltransferase
VRFDLARACVSTYADAMNCVRRRFWTTTYLTSGFWSTNDQDVINANARLVERAGQGCDLRRLFLVPRDPELEMEAQRDKRLWLRRTGEDDERRRLDDGLDALSRNIKAQLRQGFEVRVTSDERAAWGQLPRDIDFEPNDSEIAIYDDFRFDVFSGGRIGRIHSVHCYTDLTADFQGFLGPAIEYFEELWAGAKPADAFIEDLQRVRREVDAQIDYEPHWLAQYEFALSTDDEDLKRVEMHRVLEILRRHKKEGEVGDCLDIGTCTGRYPICLRQRPVAAPGSRVIGIDADPDCVRFAAAIVRKNQLQDSISIRKVDVLHEAWPIEGEFDVVTCMLGTLSHFGQDLKANHDDDLQHALKRMADVLAPGGLLFLSNWSEEACTTKKMLEIYRPLQRVRLARWTVPPHELRTRLRQVGLRVIDEAQPDVRLDLFTCVREGAAS